METAAAHGRLLWHVRALRTRLHGTHETEKEKTHRCYWNRRIKMKVPTQQPCLRLMWKRNKMEMQIASLAIICLNESTQDQESPSAYKNTESSATNLHAEARVLENATSAMEKLWSQHLRILFALKSFRALFLLKEMRWRQVLPLPWQSTQSRLDHVKRSWESFPSETCGRDRFSDASHINDCVIGDDGGQGHNGESDSIHGVCWWYQPSKTQSLLARGVRVHV